MKLLPAILFTGFFLINLQNQAQQASGFNGSFLGTTGVEEASGIVMSGSRVYITGTTSEPTFPVTPGLITDTISGSYDVFLACFDTSGALLWSTLAGGSNYELGPRLTLDPNNNLIITGYTSSTNFPTTPGSNQPNNLGSYDCFVMKTDSNGNLIWSTLFGGNGGDLAIDVDCDHNGNIYFAGQTTSQNFPVTTGAFQDSATGSTDAFVTKFSAGGSLLWSTYFGGTASEDVHALTTDQAGNVIVSGMTGSSDLPVGSNAFQTGLAGNIDIYIASFSTSGGLNFTTYLGGNNFDDALGVATDSLGNIYLAGRSNSNDFPVSQDAWQDTLAGGYDAILTSFGPLGQFRFSSFFGGILDDHAARIRFSSDGLSILANTQNDSLPSFGPSQFAAGNSSQQQVWILKFNTDFERKFSTYFNGNNADVAAELFAVDSHVVFCGTTYSTSLPYSNSNYYQNQQQGNGDVYWGMFNYRIAAPDTTTPVDTSGIHAIFGEQELSLYPNPASTTFGFSINPDEIESVQLYNTFGRLVTKFRRAFHYPVENLPNGIYLVRVSLIKGGSHSALLLVQH